jgi:hypothetical protein
MQELTLTGRDGAQFIVDNGSADYIFSSIPRCEEEILNGINKFLAKCKESQLYSEPVETSVTNPNEKEQPHQLTVECFAITTQSEGFNKNEMTMLWEDGTDWKEYIVRGATFTLNCEIKCKSTSRTSVSKLADVIFLGLQSDIDEYLKQRKITIPANSINLPQRITPLPLAKNNVSWEIPISINGITLQWQQVLEQSGETLKDFGYYLNYISAAEEIALRNPQREPSQ